MDRKSKIFAPTISAGGVRKPAKKQTSTPSNNNPMFKKVCESMKSDIRPTLVKSFSFKNAEGIFNIENAKVMSIGKNKKNVGFLITGNPVKIEEKPSNIAEPSDVENKEEETVE